MLFCFLRKHCIILKTVNFVFLEMLAINNIKIPKEQKPMLKIKVDRPRKYSTVEEYLNINSKNQSKNRKWWYIFWVVLCWREAQPKMNLYPANVISSYMWNNIYYSHTKQQGILANVKYKFLLKIYFLPAFKKKEDKTTDT